MEHVREAPYHPHGEIERWHQTLQNMRRGNDLQDCFPILLTLLEDHDLPSALEAVTGEFVDHYNHRCIHESRGNVTPANAYCGRANAIMQERMKIEEQTVRQRRLLNQGTAA